MITDAPCKTASDSLVFLTLVQTQMTRQQDTEQTPRDIVRDTALQADNGHIFILKAFRIPYWSLLETNLHVNIRERPFLRTGGVLRLMSGCRK